MGVFVLTAHLEAPVVTSDEIHLDGLLASAHPLCRQQPVGRETSLAELVRPPLPVCDLRVHRVRVALASVAEYAPEAALHTSEMVRRRDGWDIEALAQPVHLGLGPGKNTMKRLTTVVSPWVRWYGIGNRREVLRLARRCTHVGQMRAHGYGLVRAWECTYTADVPPERVWIEEGRAARHLPASVCAAVTRAEPVPLEPPYWHPQRVVEDAVRAGTRIALAPEWAALIREAAQGARDVKRRKDAVREARRRARAAS